MPRSPPKRDRHNPSLIRMTLGPFGTSSVSVNVRPMSGETCSNGITLAVMYAELMRCGWAPSRESDTFTAPR